MELNSSVGSLPYVGEEYQKKLRKLGIYTLADLVWHIPSRYLDYRDSKKIKYLKANENATVEGQVISTFNTFTKTGKQMQIIKISDGEDSIECVWFNQRYILRNLRKGDMARFSGKANFWNRKLVLMFPEYEKIKPGLDIKIHTGRIVPIYPETAGVSSKWLRSRIRDALSKIEGVEDFMKEEDLEGIGISGLFDSLKWVHMPEDGNQAKLGRERLAFNELLEKQIEGNLKKIEWRKNATAFKIKIKKTVLDEFIEGLDFELTDSQNRSIKEILGDMEQMIPMNRMLQGDVGSGKTVVAAAAIFASYVSGYKSLLMAPTQILAEQHYKTLINLLGKYGVRVELYTSSRKIETLGGADVAVGTHSLLYREHEHVGLVVIDEQHRFGVEQRAKFSEGTKFVHTLTMTATPIPRTVALTLYGELSMSTLDSLPKGRKKIKTWVVPQSKREKAEEWIANEIRMNGGQAFFVCPLIEESESQEFKEAKAAKVEHDRISKKFKDIGVGILHGRMKGKEKTEELVRFEKGENKILVSTPVIEVGIDVPQATIMVILGAERFGLAQIHQLRGRVGRGEQESYCILFSDSNSQTVKNRLSALQTAANGRELSEMDLGMRGPGEVFGVRQTGMFELKIARWDDFDLIKKSKSFAEEVVDNQEKHVGILEYFKKKQVVAN